MKFAFTFDNPFYGIVNSHLVAVFNRGHMHDLREECAEP